MSAQSNNCFGTQLRTTKAGECRGTEWIGHMFLRVSKGTNVSSAEITFVNKGD